MDERRELSDKQWARLAPLLAGKPSDPGRSGRDMGQPAAGVRRPGTRKPN
jgi:transposase